MFAIIGGTGLTSLNNLEIVHRQVVRTPYGDPSGPLTIGRIAGQDVVFLARHGYGHTYAPHRINYRANVWALKHVGVSEVISVASVGGIQERYAPGTLVIPHQIIDYTWGRVSTFFEDEEAPVTHIDFTLPFTASLRERLIRAADGAGEPVIDGAVYACTQGPRLETAAEIDRLERDGANVVGMTAMPEAALARELGLAYAAINVVANYAAGRGADANEISFTEIEATLSETMARVRHVLEAFAVLPLISSP
ncbi:S-methyl-5'-thioinosine phosphorylase [Tepidiphilus olei]|uniref:S-methyl-5'-thioinosine phosphorylase n=1 Tax=Tepidiphilus olei TaxID=2502184 RepID=UPI00115CAED4